MQYIRTQADGQLKFTESNDFLKIPSELYGFHNTNTEIKATQSNRTVYCFQGEMDIPEEELVCPECGAKMHVHAHPQIRLRHLNIGGNLSCIELKHHRFKCPKCGKTKSQFLSFKAEGF